ncbi:hypothetical protein LELG_00978 [Lodderomyces elongisporus NRRL YB-4239]|uniref:CID domain-containing protein n=1 Tax=Lodderomyces elongisporus (strain ATCC 11503 / CBS 2605 / JCM 1781 / NBRC 1676 / NRRL YB-4239) TaxID=379508 RepID=A5DUE2_LODEL|nr:hypothetical protein LELG_00978 [Lodderomyces elongisporus NRRL YB-4239]
MDNFKTKLMELRTLRGSKIIIDDLSRIALANVDDAPEIVNAVRQRIEHSSQSEKILSMYVLDSLAKEGNPYNILFGSIIYDVFTYAYVHVGDGYLKDGVSFRKALMNLLETWYEHRNEQGEVFYKAVFPKEELDKIQSFKQKVARVESKDDPGALRQQFPRINSHILFDRGLTALALVNRMNRDLDIYKLDQKFIEEKEMQQMDIFEKERNQIVSIVNNCLDNVEVFERDLQNIDGGKLRPTSQDIQTTFQQYFITIEDSLKTLNENGVRQVEFLIELRRRMQERVSQTQKRLRRSETKEMINKYITANFVSICKEPKRQFFSTSNSNEFDQFIKSFGKAVTKKIKVEIPGLDSSMTTVKDEKKESEHDGTSTLEHTQLAGQTGLLDQSKQTEQPAQSFDILGFFPGLSSSVFGKPKEAPMFTNKETLVSADDPQQSKTLNNSDDERQIRKSNPKVESDKVDTSNSDVDPFVRKSIEKENVSLEKKTLNLQVENTGIPSSIGDEPLVSQTVANGDKQQVAQKSDSDFNSNNVNDDGDNTDNDNDNDNDNDDDEKEKAEEDDDDDELYSPVAYSPEDSFEPTCRIPTMVTSKESTEVHNSVALLTSAGESSDQHIKSLGNANLSDDRGISKQNSSESNEPNTNSFIGVSPGDKDIEPLKVLNSSDTPLKKSCLKRRAGTTNTSVADGKDGESTRSVKRVRFVVTE